MFIRTGAFIRINIVSYKTNLSFFFFFFFVGGGGGGGGGGGRGGGYNMNLDFLFVLEEKTHCLITIFFF